MGAPTVANIKAGFARARTLRQPTEARMDQAFKLAMPGRGSFYSGNVSDDIDDVFDETAIVATQEFASRLQSGITPNFSRWSQLESGSDVEPEEKKEVNTGLDGVTESMFELISSSNFGQESYEAFLDLSVSMGCLEIEKGTANQPVMFNAVPSTQLWVETGPFAQLDRLLPAALVLI